MRHVKLGQGLRLLDFSCESSLAHVSYVSLERLVSGFNALKTSIVPLVTSLLLLEFSSAGVAELSAALGDDLRVRATLLRVLLVYANAAVHMVHFWLASVLLMVGLGTCC